MEENVINKIDVTKTKSTTEPRKNIERYRLYEWVVLMYGTHSANRRIFTKDGYSCLSKLSVELNEEIATNHEKNDKSYT